MYCSCSCSWNWYKTTTFWSLLTRCTIPWTCHAKPHLNRQKWSTDVTFFYILAWKCAYRHNGVHFFDISTSKSGQGWCALCILTWKRASRHNSVQFLISLLARWLRTRRFSEVTFDPPEPQIIGKTQWIVTFLPFRARASSCFSLFLFSDLLTSFLLLSDSFHLCFSICPYCRKFDFSTSFDQVETPELLCYLKCLIFWGKLGKLNVVPKVSISTLMKMLEVIRKRFPRRLLPTLVCIVKQQTWHWSFESVSECQPSN